MSTCGRFCCVLSTCGCCCCRCFATCCRVNADNANGNLGIGALKDKLDGIPQREAGRNNVFCICNVVTIHRAVFCPNAAVASAAPAARGVFFAGVLLSLLLMLVV